MGRRSTRPLDSIQSTYISAALQTVATLDKTAQRNIINLLFQFQSTSLYISKHLCIPGKLIIPGLNLIKLNKPAKKDWFGDPSVAKSPIYRRENARVSNRHYRIERGSQFQRLSL